MGAAFTGIITAVAIWSIWGTDMFPAQPDPTGGTESHGGLYYQSHTYLNIRH
jgi:hypothetical protein